MSASNVYMIQRDELPVLRERYWYPLTYQPIMDSFSVRFDLRNNTTHLKSVDIPYSYNSIETDCKASEDDYMVYTIIPAGLQSYTDNGITFIPTTSQESQIFARCLVGTTTKRDGQIVAITEENYLNFVDELIGRSFLDFSVSNQIKQVIDAVDESEDGNLVEASYFYEVAE